MWSLPWLRGEMAMASSMGPVIWSSAREAAGQEGGAVTRLAPILQGFFTGHLIARRHASPRTVASYRDTLTLLLGYAHQRSGKLPAQLDLGDLDAVLVGAFLTHLETERGNSTSTRNARLTAIRALFRYASLRAPSTQR